MAADRAAELALLRDGGWRAWRPRLPEQEILYPVLNREFAVKIARECNAPRDGVGYASRFQVRAEFLAGFQVQQAGGPDTLEY